MATKRTLRRRARGASLVEALVAIPFFIVIFIGLVFFSRLYTEKQRTISESRQRAWTYAMGNCEGSPEGATKDTETMDMSVPNSSEADLGEDSKYTDGIGGDKASKQSNTAVMTVKGSVTTSERKGDTSEYTTVKKELSSTAQVTCNEKPVDGDIFAAIGRAWSLITSSM